MSGPGAARDPLPRPLVAGALCAAAGLALLGAVLGGQPFHFLNGITLGVAGVAGGAGAALSRGIGRAGAGGLALSLACFLAATAAVGALAFAPLGPVVGLRMALLLPFETRGPLASVAALWWVLAVMVHLALRLRDRALATARGPGRG